MGTCRELNDIWYYLKRGWWKPFLRSFKGNYFWHDSFGKYWNRIIGCRILGHRNIQNIADPGKPKQMYCFKCEREVHTK